MDARSAERTSARVEGGFAFLGEGGEELLTKVMRVVRSVAAKVREEHGACCIVTNLGEYQDSKHQHWHVLFRGELPEGRV